MKHKHSEVIKAFVDGIECEYYYLGKIDAVWLPIINLRDFDFATDVRIKPEPKPDVVKYIILNYPFTYNWFESDDLSKHDCIKIIRDGKTGELKSAEVVK